MECRVLTEKELDELQGRRIFIKYSDGKFLEGKIKAENVKSVDGYSFIARLKDNGIISQGSIYPRDFVPEHMKPKKHFFNDQVFKPLGDPLRLVKNQDETYSFSGDNWCIGTSYYAKDSPNFGELSNLLDQEELALEFN